MTFSYHIKAYKKWNVAMFRYHFDSNQPVSLALKPTVERD